MKIEVLSITTNQPFIISQSKELFPDIKMEEGKPTEFKRLLRKLMRDRNVVLSLANLRLRITVPIFMYHNLLRLIPVDRYISIIPAQNDEISFETSEDFTSIEEAALLCLIKKVKSSMKGLDEHKIKYFTPLSYHITFLTYIDYLNLYEFLDRLSYRMQEEPKIREFKFMLMNALWTMDNVFFNDQLLELYQATEDKR